MTIRWEYLTKALNVTNQKELAELGNDGWELVTALPVMIQGNANKTAHCIFKRPID